MLKMLKSTNAKEVSKFLQQISLIKQNDKQSSFYWATVGTTKTSKKILFISYICIYVNVVVLVSKTIELLKLQLRKLFMKVI